MAAPVVVLQPGDVVYVGGAASCQFALSDINFRVIRVEEKPTYEGWAWVEGYQLSARGNAVERRTIFVRPEGLVRVDPKGKLPRTAKR